MDSDVRLLHELTKAVLALDSAPNVHKKLREAYEAFRQDHINEEESEND